MKRFPLIAIVWTGLLVVGFAVVLLLGTPVATSAEELDAAMHPPAPVSQADAERSAATIVRLSYPQYTAADHTTKKATDFGVEHWVIVYSEKGGSTPRGVRISVVVSTGKVEVTTFP